MDQINKKIRQMRRLKAVFKRHPKRAKTPTRELSVTISSTQTSFFKCPTCNLKKDDAETQTQRTENDDKEVSFFDAGVQVNITPTRIPRLLGGKYSSSSDSSIASPPINHDAACQTLGTGDSSSDAEINERKTTLRPVSANTSFNSSLNKSHNKYSSLFSSYSSASSVKDKTTKSCKTLNLQMRTTSAVKVSKSQNKGNLSMECNISSKEGSIIDNSDSEKSLDCAEDGKGGKKPGHMRRSSSSSSGIPIHVKLRTLQSPNIHRNRSLKEECLSRGFLGSSANSSELSSPSGDYVKGSSGEDSDPSFWNTGQHYSVLSETYTLEGAGDFLENDQSASSEVETAKNEIASPSGIRPPQVFLPEKK